MNNIVNSEEVTADIASLNMLLPPMIPLKPTFPLGDESQAHITRTFLMDVGSDYVSYLDCRTLLIEEDLSGFSYAELEARFKDVTDAQTPGHVALPHSDFDIDLTPGAKHGGKVVFVAIRLTNPYLRFHPNEYFAIMGGGKGDPLSHAYAPKVLPPGNNPRIATFKVYCPTGSPPKGDGCFSYNIGVIRTSVRPDNGGTRETLIYWDPQVKNDG